MTDLRERIINSRLAGPLAAARRLMRAPRRELDAYRDLLRTALSLAPFRRALPPPGSKGTVVVATIGEGTYATKLLLMLGGAMQMRGWRPVVIAEHRGEGLTALYARAFGLREVRYLGDHDVDDSDRALVRSTVADLLAGDTSLPAVKRWTFREAWIGPQLLSTISRATMRGAPDPSSGEDRDRLELLLPGVLERILRAERLVAELRPTRGLVVEANYALNGAVVDVAVKSGAATIQVTQPWRDDALMCRRLVRETRREHPSSLSRATLERLVARGWTDEEQRALDAELDGRYRGASRLQSRNQPGTRPFTRAELARLLDIPLDRPVAVVFSHVLWDANLFYGDDLFADYGDWFAQTATAVAKDDHATWLIKLHPANLWKRAEVGVTGAFAEEELLAANVGVLPDHIRLLRPDTEISSLSLYRHADVGVTVRGTPGMEMACFGKPVITAGSGRYSGLGFTVDAGSLDEYFALLRDAGRLPRLTPDQHDRARWHAYAVFRLRQWEMRSFRTRFGDGPAAHDLEFAAGTMDTVRQNGDLDKWARWAEGDEIDYLDHV